MNGMFIKIKRLFDILFIILIEKNIWVFNIKCVWIGLVF